MIDNTDLAYVAGFIDGEGCLYIAKRPPRILRKSPEYSLRIAISNTNIEILRWIQGLFGGSLAIMVRDAKRKNCGILQFHTKKAVQILLLIYPYLRLKKNQADILFKFDELRKSYPKRSYGGRRGTLPSCSEYLVQQERYYQNIKKLNRRGKIASVNKGT